MTYLIPYTALGQNTRWTLDIMQALSEHLPRGTYIGAALNQRDIEFVVVEPGRLGHFAVSFKTLFTQDDGAVVVALAEEFTRRWEASR